MPSSALDSLAPSHAGIGMAMLMSSDYASPALMARTDDSPQAMQQLLWQVGSPRAIAKEHRETASVHFWRFRGISCQRSSRRRNSTVDTKNGNTAYKQSAPTCSTASPAPRSSITGRMRSTECASGSKPAKC